MHVTLVHVHVKPEHVDEFIRATHENHLNSVREAGNCRFDVLQSPDDVTRFVLYEAYASEDDATGTNRPHITCSGAIPSPSGWRSRAKGVRYRGLYPEGSA